MTSHFVGFSQCLTSFQKLAPELHQSPYTHDFGQSIDILGDIAVVGIPDSDSLQSDGGLVQVYQFKGDRWDNIATLYPSEPEVNMKFGYKVMIREDHIYVSSLTFLHVVPVHQGSIYVFKKPEGGWTSGHETARLKFPENVGLLGADFEVNEQEKVLGVFSTEALFFYVQEGIDWTGHEEVLVMYPDNPAQIFQGLSIYDHNLAITVKENYEFKILLKKAINSDWTEFIHLNTIYKESDNFSHLGYHTELSDEYLLAGALASTDSLFLFHSSNGWASIDKEIVLMSSEPLVKHHVTNDQKSIHMDDSVIVIRREYDDRSAVASIYRKPVSGWESATEDQIVRFPELASPYTGGGFAYSNDHLLLQGAFEDYPETNENHILFYSLDSTAEQLIDTKTYVEFNTSGSKYGREVAIYEDILAVSAYEFDSVSRFKDVVHLFQQNAEGQWNEINTIVSETSGGRSVNLGASIAFYKDYLALGAPGFVEDSMGRNTGRVFVYKKNGNWSDVIKVAELQPSNWREAADEALGMWHSFGYNIEMAENTIIVGAPGKDLERGNNQDHGMLFIFEKGQDEEWKSGNETAKLHSEFSVGNAKIGASFAYKENTILALHHWSGDYNKAYVSVFERPEAGWLDTVENNVITIPCDNGYASFNGGMIKIQNDKVFIGDQLYRSGGIRFAGRILVLQKPFEGWDKLEIISSFTMANPVEYQALGSNFEVVGNIVITGSSFISNGYYWGEERKGEVNVFQALDPNWEEVIELVKLDGDKETDVDGFGMSVSTDMDNFIIGALYDDSKTGFGSGAAYTVPMPPIVKLIDPVCAGEEEVQLLGYPGNGVWSGAGIIDGTENKFYPGLAGPGVHELSYVTPNCHYEGKLRIKVIPKEEVVFTHPLQLHICENDSILIELDTTQTSGDFRWFFSPEASGSSFIMQEDENSAYASQPGKYWVEMYNVDCGAVDSDTVIVEKVYNTLSADSIALMCDPSEQVKINVAPLGGQWSSPVISEDHLLSASNLEPGRTSFTYEISPTDRCTYDVTLSVVYDPIEINSISYDSYEVCDGEQIEIALQFFKDSQYFLKEIVDGVEVSKKQIIGYKTGLTDKGQYQVELSKHHCNLLSNVFNVQYFRDSVFIPNVVTANKDNINDFFEIQIENATTKRLTIFDRYGNTIFISDEYYNNWPTEDYPSGIYYYECEFNTLCSPDPRKAKGWIHLLR